MQDGKVQQRVSGLSPRVEALIQEFQDISAGRLVVTSESKHDHGMARLGTARFRPLQPDEGRDARYFRKDGDADGVYLRVPPPDGFSSTWYYDPQQPEQLTHCEFVPVNRGPKMVRVKPRADIGFWCGQTAQEYFNAMARPADQLLMESVRGPYATQSLTQLGNEVAAHLPRHLRLCRWLGQKFG